MFDPYENMRKMYLGKTILLNPSDSSELKIFAKVLDVNPAGMVIEPVREKYGQHARINTTVEESKEEFQYVMCHCCFYDWHALSHFCLIGELDTADSENPSDKINDEVKHALLYAANEIKKYSYSQVGGAFQKE